MTEQSIQIKARDGYMLAGKLFGDPETATSMVIVASATGVPQGYYASFARWLGQEGRLTLTFDYRGIGDSAPPQMKGFDAWIHDWAAQDMAGVIDYCLEKKPGKLYLVGHSVGGQILGMTPGAERLDGLFLVACVSAYWRLWSGFGRLRIWLAWHALFPLIIKVMGYLPGKLYGGVDLPAGVGLQWARWGRHHDYLLSHSPDVARGFAKIKVPISVLSFSDDELAPKKAADVLFSWYSGSREKLHRHIKPEDLGVPAIGHFGFFRKRFAKKLWHLAPEWLEGPHS